MKYDEAIYQVVEEQIGFNNPPFVKDYFNLLVQKGIDRKQAKDVIANILCEEIYSILNDNKEYDEKRYKKKIEEAVMSFFKEWVRMDKDGKKHYKNGYS